MEWNGCHSFEPIPILKRLNIFRDPMHLNCNVDSLTNVAWLISKVESAGGFSIFSVILGVRNS